MSTAIYKPHAAPNPRVDLTPTAVTLAHLLQLVVFEHGNDSRKPVLLSRPDRFGDSARRGGQYRM